MAELGEPVYYIRRSEKNQVYQKIEEIGLDPGEFVWKRKLVDVYHFTWVLEHSPTGSKFEFRSDSDYWIPAGFPSGAQFWQTRLDHIEMWLHRVKEDATVPDLWEQLRSEKRLTEIAINPQLQGDVFSPQEKAYITQQLDDLERKLIKTQQLSETQAEMVKNGFLQLRESLSRLGKKDWLNYAVGTIVTLATGAALAPDAARNLLHGLMQAVGPLYEAAIRLITQ